MSRWNDQFNNHAFRTNWNTFKSLLDNTTLEVLDELISVEIARINKVVKFLDAVQDQIDPELMPISLLDSLNPHVTNCTSQYELFQKNNAISHLQNVNSNLDSIISIFSQSPFILNGQQKGALSKAATAYAETINQHLNNFSNLVETEIEILKKDVKGIETSITQNKTSLTNIENQTTTITQTIQKQTAEFTSQFQSSEKSRAEKYDGVLEKLEKKIDDEASRLTTKADGEFSKLATKAATAIEVLTKLQDDARNVFGVVINTLQAGAYSSYANEEKKTANNLRYLTMLLMLLGVMVLVVPEVLKFIKLLENYTFDWHATLGRIPFSAVLFVPAFYLARESNKHRNNEILNRRRELILSTIDPYLALLPDEKANEIKTEIAKSIFSEGSNSTNESSLDEASNLIAQITKLTKQLRL